MVEGREFRIEGSCESSRIIIRAAQFRSAARIYESDS